MTPGGGKPTGMVLNLGGFAGVFVFMQAAVKGVTRVKNTLLLWVSVGVFGFFGSLARYGVARLCGRISTLFPFGTFIINISGCLLLGWFLTYAQSRLSIPDPIRIGFAVGFVGAYTTFSTYMFESDKMLSDGASIRGILYIIGSVVLGLLAVRAGVIIGHRMS